MLDAGLASRSAHRPSHPTPKKRRTAASTSSRLLTKIQWCAPWISRTVPCSTSRRNCSRELRSTRSSPRITSCHAAACSRSARCHGSSCVDGVGDGVDRQRRRFHGAVVRMLGLDRLVRVRDLLAPAVVLEARADVGLGDVHAAHAVHERDVRGRRRRVGGGRLGAARACSAARERSPAAAHRPPRDRRPPSRYTSLSTSDRVLSGQPRHLFAGDRMADDRHAAEMERGRSRRGCRRRAGACRSRTRGDPTRRTRAA